MSSGGSVTQWIRLLKAGDEAAAQQLWERYFQRLVGLARKKLQTAPRRSADEEDVALGALDSLCRGARHGRFPKLHDRDDLWHLLVVITTRKALHLARDESSPTRGGTVSDEAAMEQILSREPTPEFAAQVAEECQRLLALLGHAELRSIAVWKMEGYSEDEIAARLKCVPRTVRRRLQRIRSLWEKESRHRLELEILRREAEALRPIKEWPGSSGGDSVPQR
jgi:DNA-directed RNA polymerase specialized sigma24 family protein